MRTKQISLAFAALALALMVATVAADMPADVAIPAGMLPPGVYLTLADGQSFDTTTMSVQVGGVAHVVGYLNAGATAYIPLLSPLAVPTSITGLKALGDQPPQMTVTQAVVTGEIVVEAPPVAVPAGGGQ